MLQRRLFLQRAAVAAATAVPALSRAQPWPARPIRFVVPFAAGVSPDVVARLLSEPLSKALGQPVVVDNRAGAAGIIGAEIAARSPGDGYTLFMAVNSIMGVNPHIYSKLPYDSLRDFVPVAQVARVPYVLVAGLNQPFRSLGEVLARARAAPGSIDYGSLGVGSGPHVVMEMLCNMAGVKMMHIPYKASPLQDVIAGQVALAFDPATTAIPMVRAGKLRALAVTSTGRLASLPDVPAVAETIPGFDGDGWQGIYAPAGTPAEVVERLNREITLALQQPAMRARLADLGLTPAAGTPREFAQLSRLEYDKWGKIVRANHIHVD
jgi:tripartite-type tricarboxylate transporter receptor subunit TctC